MLLGIRRQSSDPSGTAWALFTRPVRLREALALFYPVTINVTPGGFFAGPPAARRTKRRVLICQSFGLDI